MTSHRNANRPSTESETGESAHDLVRHSVRNYDTGRAFVSTFFGRDAMTLLAKPEAVSSSERFRRLMGLCDSYEMIGQAVGGNQNFKIYLGRTRRP